MVYVIVCVCNSFFDHNLFFYPVAVEEENEMDATIPRANNYHKLNELQRHQIKHRELFLSRQIDTYKIDMVR